jgi:hypothetical protein
MSSALQDLFQKEMSRKEFLGIIGLAICSVLGMETILKLLTGKSLAGHRIMQGYSNGDYGGNRRT